jgi:peptidoglycan/LPS O-acetylase OafA/YrhL
MVDGRRETPAQLGDNLTEDSGVTRTPKRADIQGLRALAVILVAVYHFFPTIIAGGFVGVDVFFVISGFLITLLLLKEIARTGRISLSNFYARRIRRLMPAAFTTTAVTLAAAAVILGPIRLVSVLTDAAWASASLANVHFGQNQGGYFATGQPSPFLHFWSLAVEEQYYLIWPLLLLGVALFARKHVMSAIPIVLGVIVAGSLTASVVLTASGSSHAYYSLGTRAWEIAIGGLVAFVVFRAPPSPPRWVSTMLALIGAGAVLTAAFAFTTLTSFPSWTAVIPAVGAAMMIWAGSHHMGVVGRVLSVRPARFIGDISYSLYLWHWPVLILGTAALGNGGSRVERAALLGLSVVLAVASYYLIERPQPKAHWRARKVMAIGISTALLACAAPAIAAPLVPAAGGMAVAAQSMAVREVAIEANEIVIETPGPGTTPRAVPRNVNPALGALPDDLAEVFTNGCYGASVNVCEGGDPTGSRTIVLAGDSHVGHWWPAVNQAAIQNHWKLYIVGKNGCPLAFVSISKEASAEAWPECTTWQHEATAAVVSLKPDLVIYANNAAGYKEKRSIADTFVADWSTGVNAVLQRLTSTSEVLYVGQSPTLSSDPTTCLSEHLSDVQSCSTPRDMAVTPSVRDLGESLARQAGAIYMDPADLLCTDVCPMIDRNLVMYRDKSHLTATYSQSLAGSMGSIISRILAHV